MERINPNINLILGTKILNTINKKKIYIYIYIKPIKKKLYIYIYILNLSKNKK